MRRLPIFLLFCPSLLFAQAPIATQTTTSIVSQAVAAFSPIPISQVQISGTVKAYAGSSQPSGTFTATLKPTGESKLQLNLDELSQTDVTGIFGDPGGCSRTDSAGVTHNLPDHNCSLFLEWLSPVLGLPSVAGKLNISLIDAVDANGSALHKLTFEFHPANGSKSALQMVAHLSHMELEIDPASMLPASLTFSEHPEQDASLDFPVEIRYSDYRLINGVQLPFHIQKYLRGGLSLDLQVENATVQ